MDTVEMVAENTFHRLIDDEMERRMAHILTRVEELHLRVNANTSLRERLIGSYLTLAAAGASIMAIVKLVDVIKNFGQHHP